MVPGAFQDAEPPGHITQLLKLGVIRLQLLDSRQDSFFQTLEVFDHGRHALNLPVDDASSPGGRFEVIVTPRWPAA
jgi:hypothetical protein